MRDGARKGHLDTILRTLTKCTSVVAGRHNAGARGSIVETTYHRTLTAKKQAILYSITKDNVAWAKSADKI